MVQWRPGRRHFSVNRNTLRSSSSVPSPVNPSLPPLSMEPQKTKKRGRKRKNPDPPVALPTPLDNVVDPETDTDTSAPPRKSIGRPRKRAPAASSSPMIQNAEVSVKKVRNPKKAVEAPSQSAQKGRALEFSKRSGGRAKEASKVEANGLASSHLVEENGDWREQGVRVVPSMDAVVKVFCVHTEPNFSLPWQRKRQHSSSCSGFIITGRRVLTNAHSVEHHTQIKVKKRGSDTKYLATVLAIGTECDVAMLTVDDDEFWEGATPVDFGPLPTLQDVVTVVGYPIGGDTISVTSGVVSRIEILSYVHGSTELLGLQIDAAINSGNSGGPAFDDNGKCVGIAFQSLKHEDVENIGYVIPTPVILHFIQDYEKSDMGGDLTLRGSNTELYLELARQKKKLNRLKKKDPKFSEFLERHKCSIKQLRDNDNYSDDDADRNDQRGETDEEHVGTEAKSISCSTLEVWCWLVMEESSLSALSCLLNAYQAACHYCLDDSDANLRQKILNRKVFSNILTFMLYEADGIFRRFLEVPDSCCRENVMKLKNTPPWQTLRPFIKSYLRSTLFLLNQFTDNNVLVFAVTQLRDSVVFFAAFPLLIRRLVKIVVHLWATGEESLFVSSFLLLKDMASKLSSDCLELCLTRSYKTFIARCKFVELENLKHLDHLGNSIVELYSLDVHRSYQKVLDSALDLAVILQDALRTKKKEEFKKICSWQFMKCIDIWVKFICLNIRDHDLQPLLSMVVQIIRGVAQLFPGPRHLPLRFKCAQMFNQLSSSSQIFIPVIYLVLDFLEYGEKIGNDSNPDKPVSISSVLKAPKVWLKSKDFQEECIRSSIELLSAHFSLWSYHISFPDLATIPLILLKRFYENLTVESLRRPVKRLIDQVVRNCEFVQSKRDQISFSVNDRASIESFLEMEKCKNDAPFSMYYNSIHQNAASKSKEIR